MAESVRTVLRLDGSPVHRFQVVRERRVGERDDGGGEGSDRSGASSGVEGSRGGEWIVVGFDDGGESVRLADSDFERTRSVPADAFRSGQFEPLVAGEVPVWGD